MHKPNMYNKMKESVHGVVEDGDHDTAKLEVLEELREMAMGLMGDKMKSKISPEESMKEVTVAAPDEEGLQQGLEMASEVIPGMEGEDDDMELDEIESMIRDLEEKKRSKLMKA